MNAQRYRLIRNFRTGLIVPASEAAKTRRASGMGSSSKSAADPTALASAVRTMIAALSTCGLLALPAPGITAELPVPCAGACGAKGNLGFVSQGAAKFALSSPTKATVTQTTKQAILNWNSFNIGAGGAVQFVQPGTNAVALNRIFQADPSRIAGNLSANGQIYLINQNGIIFANGAQVNVGSLVASSLDIQDAVFQNGILSIRNGDPAFSGNTGFVRVEAGAKLEAATGGRIMLLAPQVENNGVIVTSEGQTLLAAGQKIYFAASEDPTVRGLLVEVDNGGTASNLNLGQIVASRGNVTLMGLAVNQQGRVNATTAVQENGSVRLLARDTTVVVGSAGVVTRSATRGGAVELGSGSVTSVLPELGDATSITPSQTFYPSKVEITGGSIHLDPNAWIVAPAGSVSLTAAQNPSALTLDQQFVQPNNSRIYFDPGSGIDVSGVGSRSSAPGRQGEQATEIPVERNVVTVELRGNELRDDPLQRDGFLRGKTVRVDARKDAGGMPGTALADVSGYIAQIPLTVGELTAAGGTVSLRSEGDIVLRANASINASGGYVSYLPGFINTTKLVTASGKVVDIGDASPNENYVGFADVYRVTNRKWGVTQSWSIPQARQLVPGYIEGENAGTVSFVAPSMVVSGSVVGNVTAGPYQRTPAQAPIGLTLQFGGVSDPTASNPDYTLRSDVTFVAPGTSEIAAPGFGDPLSAALQSRLTLQQNLWDASGLTNLAVYTDRSISVQPGASMALHAGGAVTLVGENVDIASGITVPGGKISVQARPNITSQSTQLGRVTVEAGVHLDARGEWVNDLPTLGPSALEPVFANGGSISLSAFSDLVLAPRTLLDVSGGGWLQANRTLVAGNGGDITLAANAGTRDSDPHPGSIVLGGELRSLGLARGGSLSVTAASVSIGDAVSAAPSQLALSPAFFGSGGFSSYIVTGLDGLTVQNGTLIAPVADNLQLGQDYSTRRSGSNLLDFTQVVRLDPVGPVPTRAPVDLTLVAGTVTSGNLLIGTGASIAADPGANVSLTASRQLTVLGSVVAPGGSITLTMQGKPGNGELIGFIPEQSIWLGDASVLNVAGLADVFRDSRGLRKGTVTPGGDITIVANKGYVVAQRGAVLDVSGTAAVLDLADPAGRNAGITAREVWSDAGSISIRAREGVLLDASFKAHGGAASAAGGSFALVIDRDDSDVSQVVPPYPLGSRDLVLSATGTSVPDGLAPGQAIDLQLNGKAYVAADRLAQGGFDDIALKSRDTISVQGSVTLAPRASVTLDAPALSLGPDARLAVRSFDVSLGNFDPRYQDAGTHVPDPTSGSGTLSASASLIDLVGNVALQGVGVASFRSSGDIRLIGVLPIDRTQLDPIGHLAAAGDLEFAAAQLYPTTLSSYTLETRGAAQSMIRFESTGRGAPPLSAGGELIVLAPEIVQEGTLRAPLGTIRLQASDTLTLAAGSVTSVSADGLMIPFGSTQNGREWVYNFGDRLAVISGPPEKRIALSAGDVTIANGAVLDLSGGGDLYGYEFTVGPGGSKDVLASPGTFAVLPGFSSPFAPFDYQYRLTETAQAGGGTAVGNTSLRPGDSVYLSGAPGLPAGNYTLLPAHYALLPGAYTVTAQAGTLDMTPILNSARLDGSSLVAGYLQSAAGTRNARWSGFVVAPGTVARKQSDFTDSFGNAFFSAAALTAGAAAPRLPRDAGRFSVETTSHLVLDGSVAIGADAPGRRGEVDISAPNILITDGDASTPGFLTLHVADLLRLNPESLVIGAIRDESGSQVSLNVGATEVRVENSADAGLSAQEIVLAATDAVSVKAGSVVEAKGAVAAQPPVFTIGSNANGISGDGAMLYVGTGKQIGIVRENTTRQSGTLDVAAGATIRGSAVTLDATKDNLFQGNLDLGSGGSLRLGASRISIGDGVQPTEGLVFGSGQIAKLAGLSEIFLKSYSTIDLYGAVDFASTAPGAVIGLEAGGIVGYTNPGMQSQLTASRVLLSNPDQTAIGTPAGALGTGSLLISATSAELGSNAFTVQGFSNGVKLSAAEIIGTSSGSFDVTGPLTLEAGRITATSGAKYQFSSTANLTTAARLTTTPLAANTNFGGEIDLSGATILHGGSIDVAAGTVRMHATGGAGGDAITLADDSEILARGYSKTLFDTALAAPAGQVFLVADRGDVSIGKGAVVDLRGVSGGDAGLLSISAIQGGANVLGTLKGWASGTTGGGTPAPGRFSLDVLTLADFGALNSRLELRVDGNGPPVSGGFTSDRTLRVRTGDVTIGQGVTVTAANFQLAVDDGNIDVAGAIDATGPKGGNIALLASQKQGSGRGNVAIESTAHIDAHATQAPAEQAGSLGGGGKVLLATATDDGTTPLSGSRLSVAAGATFDVSGTGLGAPGEVDLRAPRLGSDVAVTNFDATVTGAGLIALEAFKVYSPAPLPATGAITLTNTTGAGQLNVATLDTDNDAFMANSAAIASRLGLGADPRFAVRPGVEVRSSGDLIVSVGETAAAKDARGWDLSTWRYAGQPGALTLRAAGNLDINGSISDGFTKVAGTALPGWTLASGDSWSYRLVGGADFASANPAAVVAAPSSATGNVNISFGRIGTPADPALSVLRTGTGSITVAAARNFELGFNGTGNNSSAAVLYTAGTPDTQDYSTLGSFTAPARANYPVRGGDITIYAGQDVRGAVTPQLASSWLFRQGFVDANGVLQTQTSWWPRFDRFQQNVATLGGGDLTIVAGRDVDDLSASVATSARMFVGASNKETLVVRGGGDLSVSAGGDVRGGVFFVDKGTGVINAGGSLAIGQAPASPALYPILALGDASFRVVAAGDISLETVLNPTAVTQQQANASNVFSPQKSYFFNYGADSAVQLTSITGNVLLDNDTAKISSHASADLAILSFDPKALAIYPGTLEARALNGDITVARPLALYPEPRGNLELLAAGSVAIGGTINVADSSPDRALPPTAPQKDLTNVVGRLLTNAYSGIDLHDPTLLHLDDTAPVKIYAGTGDITSNNATVAAILPKPAQIYAGRDIVDVTLGLQNLHDDDVTSIFAGRDIRFTTARGETNELVGNSARIEISGPGRLQAVAGRNFDLGNAFGLLSRGNLDNPALPEQGASLTLLVGATSADYADFAQHYLAPGASSMRSYQSELVSFVREATGNPDLPAEDAWATFEGLPAMTQQAFERWAFFNELKETGREANDPASATFRNYDRGYAAIASLFPEKKYAGDLNVFFSQIKTERGGDIEMLVPGGRVVAGLASVPADLIASKDTDARAGVDNSASSLGIVTVKGGTIRAFTQGDFLVNSARVFTLAGGDILMWSSEGNIDAGKGAKTAAAAPPPVIRTDPQGNTFTDLQGTASGSGIGLLLTVSGITPGDVDLIAPKGEVNAGDAGIRAAGNLNIAALRVVGADNIRAGGISTGVPATQVAGVGAGLSGVASAAADATRSAEKASQQMAADASQSPTGLMPSFITVEVLGFGEDK